MSSRALAVAFITSLVLFSKSADAFVDSPIITPLHPKVGEIVLVSIRAGECDGFYDGDPGYPKISRIGNAIRIVLSGAHADGNLQCIFPPLTTVVPIGTFAEGAYTLQVDRRYEPFFDPQEVVETLGTLPFVVGNSAPIPLLSLFGLFALLAGLAAVAWLGFRRVN